MHKVRAGKLYKYDPVPLDIYDARTDLKKGEIVKVVNMAGCPKDNTMRHCHVEENSRLARLVHCDSLEELMNVD